MEKKQNRSVQTPTKGVVTDSKKSQDTTNGKFWPRNGRRREPVANNVASRNEPNRKPTPQRNKALDKRPKPRGGYYSGAVGGKESTGVAERDAEWGSVFLPGSKKQSLNHLLNFHYTPRGDHAGAVFHRSGPPTHRLFSTQKHKYNKEQFLQANCQFVVDSSGDYRLYMNNPDALVDWDLVEQIHVQVSEFPSCPICLYPPVAAKMTRCGHVYCWSCILHYLKLSEKSWRKCPICYESVHKNDLKSVIAIPHAAFNIGEQITFRLMKRACGSLMALPVAEENITRNVLLNMSETEVNTVYSKLLLANANEVMSIINRERTELNSQLNENVDSSEKCFIDQAITMLQERENNVLTKIESLKPLVEETSNLDNQKNDNTYEKIDNVIDANMNSKIIEPSTRNSNECQSELDRNRSRYQSVSSEGFDTDDCNISVTTEDLEMIQEGPSTSNKNVENIKHYYFYQAADGQHIYMHALNIRMLEHTYGALEHCPKTIHGRILEKEGGSMTEDLRKRLRYLQHLPVTCQFEVAEIQLRPPVVNKDTWEHFHEQIETRKKRRQRRARDEKRREKRIADEENRRMGRLPEANVHIESLRQFPNFGEDDPVLGSSPRSTEDTPPTSGGECSTLPPVVEPAPREEQYTGPSFAKMLATGKSKTSWPGLKSTQSTSTPSSLMSVTKSKSVPHMHATHSDSEPDSDGYIPAPAFNQSFGDAIAFALEKASLSEQDNVDFCVGGKKKKKNKQKILFATSMVYSGK